MEEVKSNEKVESPIEKDKTDSKIVEQEKKDRVNKCGKEIIVVLKNYNCDFDVSMTLRQGSIVPNIQIVAK